MTSNARRLSTLGERRRNEHADADDDDDGGAMAQIIISKETSKGQAHREGLGLGHTGGSDAPLKDLHYESCCFHYFLARAAASARATPQQAQTTNLNKTEEGATWRRKSVCVLYLHPEGICQKDSSYDISDLSNCAQNMRCELELELYCVAGEGWCCGYSRLQASNGAAQTLLCCASLAQI